MANCTLCNKKASFFTRSTFNGLSGYVCSECGNHIQSLRNCYYGSESSGPHISYLEHLKEGSVSQESQLFISNELISHKDHVKTKADSYVDEKLSSTPIFISNFKLVDGIPNWPQNMIIVTIELYDDCLLFWRAITPKQNQSPSILKTESIINTEYLTEKEIIEKSKSVVGRATAGALIFGPVGALIGGMSGIGNSQKQKSHTYYIIHYINSKGEEAIITLEIGCAGCHWNKFDDLLKLRIRKTSNNAPEFL
ncbi:hypothetical protein [Parablautia intestinalis]|uniref:hypothetical protein n=1 Tax=Parablautia intestinalis TaxID=2320100 RepID=UPI00256EEE22|nr:hypothetical protein [Parablautia intestinalis]